MVDVPVFVIFMIVGALIFLAGCIAGYMIGSADHVKR